MARFRHPFKRRPRPEVHGALQRALEAITGQTFESPEQLESHLRERRLGGDRRARVAFESESEARRGAAPLRIRYSMRIGTDAEKSRPSGVSP